METCRRRNFVGIFAGVFCLSALLDGAPAQQIGAARSVHANAVTSDAVPRVRITVPAPARFVGSDRWVLYGIADCDLYAFVEADAAKKVRRLYWIQFEGYVSAMPKLHHQYDSTDHMRAGGMDFFIDTWVEATNPVQPPDLKPLEAFLRANGYAVTAAIGTGSDEEHVVALLHAKGYRLPAGMMAVRFVHVLNDRRNEVMIIYSEDLASTGLSAARLRKGGDAFDRWPAIAADLTQRGEARVRIEPLSFKDARRAHGAAAR